MRPELTRTMSHRDDALRVVIENMTAEILQFAADMGFREAPVVLGVRPDGTSTWWAGLDFARIAEFVGLARKAADRV